MGSKMYDFAKVFIGFREHRKSQLAESELRFYLSTGSKMYDFALCFYRVWEVWENINSLNQSLGSTSVRGSKSNDFA